MAATGPSAEPCGSPIIMGSALPIEQLTYLQLYIHRENLLFRGRLGKENATGSLEPNGKLLRSVSVIDRESILTSRGNIPCGKRDVPGLVRKRKYVATKTLNPIGKPLRSVSVTNRDSSLTDRGSFR